MLAEQQLLVRALRLLRKLVRSLKDLAQCGCVGALLAFLPTALDELAQTLDNVLKHLHFGAVERLAPLLLRGRHTLV